MIFDRGMLTKDEIEDLWPPDERHHQARRSALDRERLFEPSARGVGEFKARSNRRQLPGIEAAPAEQLPSSDWEQVATQRLAELRDYRQLEEQFGERSYAMRRARIKQTGDGRPDYVTDQSAFV